MKKGELIELLQKDKHYAMDEHIPVTATLVSEHAHGTVCNYVGTGIITVSSRGIEVHPWDYQKEQAKKERNIDADELIRRIEEKAKMSKNEDVINGLCGAVAIIYDLLIEDGLEQVEDE